MGCVGNSLGFYEYITRKEWTNNCCIKEFCWGGGEQKVSIRRKLRSDLPAASEGAFLKASKGGKKGTRRLADLAGSLHLYSCPLSTPSTTCMEPAWAVHEPLLFLDRYQGGKILTVLDNANSMLLASRLPQFYTMHYATASSSAAP